MDECFVIRTRNSKSLNSSRLPYWNLISTSKDSLVRKFTTVETVAFGNCEIPNARSHFPTIRYRLVGDFTKSKQTEENTGVITYYSKCFIVKQQAEVHMVVLHWFCFCNDVIHKFSLLDRQVSLTVQIGRICFIVDKFPWRQFPCLFRLHARVCIVLVGKNKICSCLIAVRYKKGCEICLIQKVYTILIKSTFFN